MKFDTLKLSLAAAALLAAAAPAAAQEITIRYASPSAASDPTQEAMVWFTEEVTKRTDGKVKFDLFLGNSLVKDQDIASAIGDGLIEMGKIYTVSYPGQMPFWNMTNLPFTHPSPYVAINVAEELRAKYPIFDKELEQFNVRALGVVATGGVGIVSNKPIAKYEDLQGFKTRARGVQAAAFTAAGATPISIPWNDVYEALSKGVVEGSTNYIITVRPIKHNEVSKYYIAAGLGQAVQLEIINRDFWDALPDDIKTVMTETMRDAQMRFAERASQLAIDEQKALAEDTGPGHMEYSAMPAEEIKKWRESSPDFFAEWAAENADAADTQAIVADYMALQEKYIEEGRKLGVIDMW